MYKYFLKNIFDFVFAFLGLILFSPLLLLITVSLFITYGGKNVFFIQPRPGKNGEIFNLIKFKTMTDEKDFEGNLLPDENRLTKIGKFVRSTSMDEILQLINVLKGDMSIIGPRPLLIKYLQFYTIEQNRRHEVKPGITGLAQINGRNAISWEKKFKYDVFYVDNLSIALDLKIMFKTIYCIFKRKDINFSANNSIKEFQG